MSSNTNQKVAASCGTIGCLGIIIVGIFVGSIYGLSSCHDAVESIAKNAPPPQPTIDKSEAAQAARLKIIRGLQQEGVIREITPGSIPRVWVTPLFHQLDFKTKQNFISVIAGYYYDGSEPAALVYLYDVYSGKKVGTYEPTFGLEMK